MAKRKVKVSAKFREELIKVALGALIRKHEASFSTKYDGNSIHAALARGAVRYADATIKAMEGK